MRQLALFQLVVECQPLRAQLDRQCDRFPPSTDGGLIEAFMPFSTTAWTTLIAGAAGVLGGLLSQIISARATLRVRQLDIYWQAKSGAYKGLVEQFELFGGAASGIVICVR
jgi:hypothetical protein